MPIQLYDLQSTLKNLSVILDNEISYKNHFALEYFQKT